MGFFYLKVLISDDFSSKRLDNIHKNIQIKLFKFIIVNSRISIILMASNLSLHINLANHYSLTDW